MISLVVIIFCVLLVIGIPVAYSMGISAAFVIAIDPNLLDTIITQKIFTSLDSFSFIAIPLFMIAGSLMNSAGITEKIIYFCKSLVGHFKGGLAHATVFTGMLMAGVSGSSVADSSAIATVMVPSLEKEGYDRGFAGALISSAGSLGPIIPPSIIMIVYSGVVSISVGSLFVAGIVPGILLGIGMLIYSYMYAKKHGIPQTKFAGIKNILKAFLKCFGALIMPFIIIGGIVTGIVTATESGILAIIYGIVYGLITKNLNITKLKSCVYDAVKSATQPMIIIAFAALFGYVLTYYGLAGLIQDFMTSFVTNGTLVLLIIFVIIFFAGMFIESTAILLVLVPVFAPLIPIYGFDPLHFAMVCIISLVLGGITPPVGIVMYVVSGVSSTPLNRVIRNIWPFVLIFSIGVLLVILLPQIVLFLPNLL
jgi:tripartite ATP-independent transporter DctM subunit